MCKANSPSFAQNSPSLPQNSVSSRLRNSTLETALRPFPTVKLGKRFGYFSLFLLFWGLGKGGGAEAGVGTRGVGRVLRWGGGLNFFGGRNSHQVNGPEARMPQNSVSSLFQSPVGSEKPRVPSSGGLECAKTLAPEQPCGNMKREWCNGSCMAVLVHLLFSTQAISPDV